MSEPSAEDAPAAAPRRRALFTALRWSVTLGCIALLALRPEWPMALQAMTAIPLAAPLAAAAFLSGSLVAGALRFRHLLAAFGATRLPSVAACVGYVFVGFFYNSFLPGAVVGDVVRAYATRDAFGDGDAAATGTVVFVERVTGLVALLLLAGVMVALRPLPAAPRLDVALLGLALGTALSLVVFPFVRRAMLRRDWRGARWLVRVPELKASGPLLVGLGYGMVSHGLVALSGHMLARALEPGLPWRDSFVVMPLGAAIGYLPFSVAGVGLRETALAELYVHVGMASRHALAVALLFPVVQWTVASFGAIPALRAKRTSKGAAGNAGAR